MNTYALYRTALLANHTAPLPWMMRVAERLADLRYAFSRADREAVHANLRFIQGEGMVVPEMAREVFRNFGRYLVEFFNAHRPQSPLVCEGAETLRQVIPAAHGSIVLTGHLGNWELGAIMLRRCGFPVSAVVLPHQHHAVNRLFDAQRIRCGVDVVPLGDHATARCLEVLRQGSVLGMVGDRTFRGEGIPVSFFGRRVVLPRGPALLSLRTGAPVIPVFFLREGPWRFRFHLESPIWPPQGSRRMGQVRALTQTYAEIIERYIRRFPTQWLMFQSIGAFEHPVERRHREPTVVCDHSRI